MADHSSYDDAVLGWSDYAEAMRVMERCRATNTPAALLVDHSDCGEWDEARNDDSDQDAFWFQIVDASSVLVLVPADTVDEGEDTHAPDGYVWIVP